MSTVQMEVGLGRGSRSSMRALGVLRKKDWPGAVATVAILVCYALTLLPGMHHFGDVTKAQFLGRFLGMTHPTGYPTYILLTSTLAELPLGTLALRMNFFSALCGAIAGLLVYALCRKVGSTPIQSALGSCIFAFSRLVWDQAVIAEVYALNAAFVAGTLFALACWLSSGERRHFLWAVGVYAFSFGNHLTMVTLLPAFLGATLLGRWRALLNKSTILGALGLITLGAAQYAYLFLASSSDSIYLEYRVTTWNEFLNFVSGDHYRGRMFAFNVQEIARSRLPLLCKTVFRDLGVLSLLIPVGAFVWMRAGSRSLRFKLGAVLLLALLGESGWYLGYNIPDIEIYSIPIVLAGTPFVVAALGRLSELPFTGSKALVLGGAALSVAWSLYENAPDHTQSARFEKMVDREIDAAGSDSVIVGRIGYDERMGWVYRLFVDGLAEKRNLSIDHNATPERVVKYLKGRGHLRNFYTREKITPGKRVFLTSRGYRGQRWGKELSTSAVVGPLREVTLRKAKHRKAQ